MLLGGVLVSAPYSLGKLIDWKRSKCWLGAPDSFTPYSLGKLIDWKQDDKLNENYAVVADSLLAREINWLETTNVDVILGYYRRSSLLAREINWLETRKGMSVPGRVIVCSLLAREINWLETDNLELVCYCNSLLAREINWLETPLTLSGKPLHQSRLPTR